MSKPPRKRKTRLSKAQFFGICLYTYRRWRKMSQEDLAKAAGVKLESLKRMEAGEYRPSMTTIVRIANALKVWYRWLSDSIAIDPDKPWIHPVEGFPLVFKSYRGPRPKGKPKLTVIVNEELLEKVPHDAMGKDEQ